MGKNASIIWNAHPTGSFPAARLVPEQESLSCYVPTVLGPIEYREWKSQLERIHEVLGLSRVKEILQRLSLAQRNQAEQRAAEKENRPFYKWSPVEQESYQRLCSQVLRCNVARRLTGESLYDFGCRLAELAEALDLEVYFLDTTCVKLHINFPVDWVLLRDAARTLMKATILIRKRNLKVRMEEPEEFLKRMNRLSMKMTHARRKKDAKRARKGVLREMKKLSKIIAAHAERHRDLLRRHWQETDFKEGEARQGGSGG